MNTTWGATQSLSRGVLMQTLQTVVALLSAVRGEFSGSTVARSLLSLNSTSTLLRKQPWQPVARAAFCLFPGALSGKNTGFLGVITQL